MLNGNSGYIMVFIVIKNFFRCKILLTSKVTAEENTTN